MRAAEGVCGGAIPPDVYQTGADQRRRWGYAGSAGVDAAKRSEGVCSRDRGCMRANGVHSLAYAECTGNLPYLLSEACRPKPAVRNRHSAETKGAARIALNVLTLD